MTKEQKDAALYMLDNGLEWERVCKYIFDHDDITLIITRVELVNWAKRNNEDHEAIEHAYRVLLMACTNPKADYFNWVDETPITSADDVRKMLL